MLVAVESGQSTQMRVSEGFCREINKLDIPARLHALGLIVDSLKNHDTHIVSEDVVPHLTDLRGIGCGGRLRVWKSSRRRGRGGWWSKFPCG